MCQNRTSASQPRRTARTIALSQAVLDRSLPKAQVQGQIQTARRYDTLFMQELGHLLTEEVRE
jgi:hypothetical protein